MAFIKSGNTVISFAEFQDVSDADSRLFETNEGLSDDIIESFLIRATDRNLNRLRSSNWWVSYYIDRSTTTVNSVSDVPPLDPNKILARQNDFTDLCVATAMAEYILPKVADFGAADNAELNKMGHYSQRADKIFAELITAGDWYDFDGAGTITSNEKQPGVYNLRRVR
jgi:hypothetical protein